jgi:hypothetical protein
MQMSPGDTGEPLTLAHQAEIEPLLQARWGTAVSPEALRDTLSDPWFANLYLFGAAHGWRLLRGDRPCIAGRAYDGTRLLLPLFDLAEAPVDALRVLLQGHDAFGPMSDTQIARLDPAVFAFSHSRDDADYVYSAEQFRHYRGTLLQKKRNLVTQLLAAHEVRVQRYTPSLADQALPVLQAWLDHKGKHAGDADDLPCREALRLADDLGLDGWLHSVDGQAAGFVLAQHIRPGVAVMRFAKALPAFKGLVQHMFQHCARSDASVQWINFEQDLGLANFRQTKLSYQPVALLDKHRVCLRG